MAQHEDARGLSALSLRVILTTVAAGLVIFELLLTFAGNAAAVQSKPMLMFVQVANDIKVDSGDRTLRLIGVGRQTLYFADRPERIAGHIMMADFLAEWTAKAGSNNFGSDPPNATLSVFEPGKSKDTLAVVKISNPRVEGSDLLYDYQLIEGTLPSNGGAASLFIDWIARGGGVGFGYYGVGVGYRGPGWR